MALSNGILIFQAFVTYVFGKPVPLCQSKNRFLVHSDVGPQMLCAVVVLVPTQPCCVLVFRRVRVAVAAVFARI